MPGYDCFAWDARGLGRSPAYAAMRTTSACSSRTPNCFVRYLSTRYDIAVKDMAVIAQSLGAVVAAAWVHDYAPDIRCLVLASPALKIKLYVPFARQLLTLKQKFKRGGFVNSYVTANRLTHDEMRRRSYESDPLVTRPIAENILIANLSGGVQAGAGRRRYHDANTASGFGQRLGRALGADEAVVRQSGLG